MAARADRSSAGFDWALVLVALFTALAFALRLRGIGESLYHDELYTYVETHGRSFSGMLDAVANGSAPGVPLENTPPLHFTLAWLGIQLGDPTTTIRLPSLILGTATVPAVFLLGRRAMDARAALAGAGFVALSPFATFYGIDARAYGMLMFVSVLSALVLLRAVEARRTRWWIAYAAATAAVLYTHYTGVLIVAVEALWVVWRHRDAWRPLLLGYLGVAVAYAPWLPYLHNQPAEYDKLAALVGRNDWSAFLAWIAGSPEAAPSDIPGVAALVLLGCGFALAAVAAFIRRPALRPGGELVLLLAVAMPVVLLVYAAAGTDLFIFPRNMSAALPFAALAIGWLVTRPQPRVAAIAVGLVAVALGIGAARTLEDRFHRPNFPAVAQLVDERAGPGDRLVYYGAGYDPFILRPVLRIYLHREPAPRGSDISTHALWGSFDQGRGPDGRTYLVEFADPLGPPSVPGWEETEQHSFVGAQSLVFAAYDRLRPSRYRGLSVQPGRADGAVDSAAVTSDGTVTLGGWALTRDAGKVSHVLAFVGDRLVAAGIPGRPRPDVAAPRSIEPDRIGFSLASDEPLTPAERARLRVIAVTGGVGSPLPRYCPGVRPTLACPEP